MELLIMIVTRKIKALNSDSRLKVEISKLGCDSRPQKTTKEDFLTGFYIGLAFFGLAALVTLRVILNLFV